jgi:hypothetical protein
MTTSTWWPRIGSATYRATTQEDRVRREANPHAGEHLMASPQVVESTPRTISMWRHGFEPRWDYKCKAPGQGTSRESTSWLNRGSTPNIPQISRIGSSIGECRSGARVEGGCTRPPPLAAIADPARKVSSRSRWTRSQLPGIAKELPFRARPEQRRVRAVNRVAGEGRGRRLGAHEARTGDGLPTADPIRSDPGSGGRTLRVPSEGAAAGIYEVKTATTSASLGP